MRQGTGGRSATRWGQGGRPVTRWSQGGGRATVTRRRRGGRPVGDPSGLGRTEPKAGGASDPAEPLRSGRVRSGETVKLRLRPIRAGSYRNGLSAPFPLPRSRFLREEGTARSVGAGRAVLVFQLAKGEGRSASVDGVVRFTAAPGCGRPACRASAPCRG